MESPPQREPEGLQEESPPQREPEKLRRRVSAPEGLQKESPLQREPKRLQGAPEEPRKGLHRSLLSKGSTPKGSSRARGTPEGVSAPNGARRLQRRSSAPEGGGTALEPFQPQGEPNQLLEGEQDWLQRKPPLQTQGDSKKEPQFQGSHWGSEEEPSLHWIRNDLGLYTFVG